MDRISIIYSKFATRGHLQILFGLWIILYFSFGKVFSVIEGNIPDIMFHYSPEQLYYIFNDLGEEGRNIYVRGSLLLDYLYPLVYGGFLSLSLFALSAGMKISTLPWVVSFLDYIENINLLLLIRSFPDWDRNLAFLNGFVTSAKWISIIVVISILAVFAIKRLVKSLWLRNRGNCIY